VDPDRSCNVLEVLGAEILEIEINLVGDPIMDHFRNIDAARLGQRLDPRRDVDTLTEDVARLEDDVAEIDPDPHRDAWVGRKRLVHWRQGITQPRRAARRFDRVVEIDEYEFGGLLEYVSAEFGNLRFDDRALETPQLGKILLFVAREQPIVAPDHNGR